MTVSHLDYFKQKNIKVAFFFMANRLNNKSLLKIIKRAKREGHIIANHNYYHTSIMEDFKKDKSPAKIKNYFRRSTELFYEKLGVAPRFMRPPFGDISDKMAQKVNELTGLKIIMWNLDTKDWYHKQKGQNPNRIVQAFYNEVNKKRSPMDPDRTNSYISLQHDKGIDFKADLKRLDIILEFLKRKGFKFVRLDKCLNEKAYFKI